MLVLLTMSVLEEYVGFLTNPESVKSTLKDKLFNAIPIHGQLMFFNHETSYIMFMAMTDELKNIPVYTKIKIEDITASDVSKLGNDAFNVLKLELQVLVYVKQDPFFSDKNFVPQTWTGVYMVPMNISLEAVEVEAKKQGFFSKMKLSNPFSRKALEEGVPIVDIVKTREENVELTKFMTDLHNKLGPLRNAIGAFNSANPDVDYDILQSSIVKYVNENDALPEKETNYLNSLSQQVVNVSSIELITAYRSYKSIRKIGDNDLVSNPDYIQYMAIIDHLVAFMRKLKGITDDPSRIDQLYFLATGLRKNINERIVPLQNELEMVRGVRSGIKDVAKTTARLTGQAWDAAAKGVSRATAATVRAFTDPTNAKGKMNDVFTKVNPVAQPQAGGSKTKKTKVSRKSNIKNHKK